MLGLKRLKNSADLILLYDLGQLTVSRIDSINMKHTRKYVQTSFRVPLS